MSKVVIPMKAGKQCKGSIRFETDDEKAAVTNVYVSRALPGINEAKEILVQLYAYVGFPRSLNALGELMRVVEARRDRGIRDEAGAEPSRVIPKGDELLAAGTANQTKISGAPVQGPLFEFAPVINQYLRTHLFGDIFERDNLEAFTLE